MKFDTEFWNHCFDRFINESGQTPPLTRDSSDLRLGKSRLCDSLDLAQEWLSWIAGSTGEFEPFDEFLQRFRQELSQPPKAFHRSPDADLYEIDPHRYIREKLACERAQAKWEASRRESDLRQSSLAEFRSRYTRDAAGYVRHLEDRFGDSLRQFNQQLLEIPISESQRARHTYVCGGTGSGKTELLKRLIHHYLTTNRETAVIILDPHGDFARQCARFRENSDSNRLVYIHPRLHADLGFFPALNPFEVGPLTEDEFAVIEEELTEQLTAALGEDAQMTSNMATVLEPCVATLLRMPDGHFGHLHQFMRPDDNAELKAFGANHLSNPEHIRYLNDELDSAHSDTTRAIRTKLQKLLNNTIFRRFLTRPSTFDLEQAIDERKLIVFDVSRAAWGARTSETVGRLIMARLFGIASLRGRLSEPERRRCVPIQLFIDEAQHYCTSTTQDILKEARKFRLHLTLANQRLDDFSADIARDIEDNTLIKLVGRQDSPRSKNRMSGLCGVDSFPDLGTGHFLARVDQLPAYLFVNEAELIDDRNAMHAGQWETVLGLQKDRYYEPAEIGSPADQCLPSTPRSEPAFNFASEPISIPRNS